ncbi:MAG: HD-GYP domain-containing protein, partial [Bacillota bacterium]
VRYVLLLGGAIFLWWGTELYVKYERPRMLYLRVLAVAVGCLVTFVWISWRGTLSGDIVIYFSGLVYLLSGYTVLRISQSPGQKLLGWLYSIWGIYIIEQPLVATLTPDLVTSGYIIVSFMAGLLAISVVVLALEVTRLKHGDYLQKAVMALSTAMEAKDTSTTNHSQRVAVLAAAIAAQMGLNKWEVQRIRFAGLLHDLGKIGIPDSILFKQGKLTPEEFTVIKRHPMTGYRILHAAGEVFNPIMHLVKHHHERWDGTGYPQGLKGKDIPLGASILAVADAFEAMTSRRPYREPLIEEKALLEIEANINTQFHPQVASLFVDHFGDILKMARNGLSSDVISRYLPVEEY